MKKRYFVEPCDNLEIGVFFGDFRPSRKGPFGRFKVTHWKAES